MGPDGSGRDGKKSRTSVARPVSAQMLSIVGINFRAFIVPKPPRIPITDFEQHIIKDASGEEVKEWLAIAVPAVL